MQPCANGLCRVIWMITVDGMFWMRNATEMVGMRWRLQIGYNPFVTSHIRCKDSKDLKASTREFYFDGSLTFSVDIERQLWCIIRLNCWSFTYFYLNNITRLLFSTLFFFLELSSYNWFENVIQNAHREDWVPILKKERILGKCNNNLFECYRVFPFVPMKRYIYW